MSVIVAYDEQGKRVYPPHDQKKRLPANSDHRRVRNRVFGNVQEAKKFYLSKFFEYHPQLQRGLK